MCEGCVKDVCEKEQWVAQTRRNSSTLKNDHPYFYIYIYCVLLWVDPGLAALEQRWVVVQLRCVGLHGIPLFAQYQRYEGEAFALQDRRIF